MEKGRIISGHGGFYQVVAQDDILSCRLRGRLRLEYKRVLVGDLVLIRRQDSSHGVVEEVLPRQNQLERPPIANIEQLVAVVSVSEPPTNFRLLDRMLAVSEVVGLRSIICINKADLSLDQAESIQALYKSVPYPVILTSSKKHWGLEQLRQQFIGRVSAVAGPSGVGKSSLLNSVDKSLALKTGDISEKLGRGRHTTRTVCLLQVGRGLVADTPGFSQLSVGKMEVQAVGRLFPDIRALRDDCQFPGCLHDKELRCAVKQGVAQGVMAASRYESYLALLTEVKNQQHWRRT